MGVKEVRKENQKEMTKVRLKAQILKDEDRDPFVYMVVEEAYKILKVKREYILLGPSDERFANARYIIMYIVNKLNPMSLKLLGWNLNYKDHTSVLYGIGKIDDLVNKPSNNKKLHKNLMDVMSRVRLVINKDYMDPEKEYELLLDQEADMILDLEYSERFRLKEISETFKQVENQL